MYDAEQQDSSIVKNTHNQSKMAMLRINSINKKKQKKNKTKNKKQTHTKWIDNTSQVKHKFKIRSTQTHTGPADAKKVKLIIFQP